MAGMPTRDFLEGVVVLLLKRLFCKHQYEAEYLHMIWTGSNKLYKFKCVKCGSVAYGDMDSKKWKKVIRQKKGE